MGRQVNTDLGMILRSSETPARVGTLTHFQRIESGMRTPKKPSRRKDRKMDNSHQEETTINQSAEQTAHKIVADELSPARAHIADETERPAHSNPDFITGQAETFRQILLSGSELASDLTARCTDQFVRAIGIGGEALEDRPQQVAGTILQSGTAVARYAQAVSAELVALVLQRTKRSLDHLDAMTRSRTPQDFAAAQSEALRDQAEGVIEGTRRIAEITLRTADAVSRQVKATVGRIRRAA